MNCTMTIFRGLLIVSLFCGLVGAQVFAGSYKVVVLDGNTELNIDWSLVQSNDDAIYELTYALGEIYRTRGGAVNIGSVVLRAHRDTQSMPGMFTIEQQFKSYSRLTNAFGRSIDIFGCTIMCYTEDNMGSDAVRALVAIDNTANEAFSAEWLVAIARAYSRAHDLLKTKSGEANPEYYGIKTAAAALVARLYDASDSKRDEAVDNFINGMNNLEEANSNADAFRNRVGSVDIYDKYVPFRTYNSGSYIGTNALELLNSIISGLVSFNDNGSEQSVASNEPLFDDINLLSANTDGSGSQI